MNNVKSLKEIVKQLRSCGYTCEAGPMENNVDFQMLERIAGVEPERTLADSMEDARMAIMEAGNALINLGKLAVRSPQEIRDDIIKQAKRDVAGILGEYDSFSITVNGYVNQAVKAKFVVNAEKRTIVALIYGHFSGKMYHRGIAKCAPDDCFNVHIGKAIALRRALGLVVPAEYLSAPQPMEVHVGDSVEVRLDNGECEVRDVERVDKVAGSVYLKGRIIDLFPDYAKIIDDSREEVAE